MPDIDLLNIINVNIHSIGTEQAGDGDNCYTNKLTVQRQDRKQETELRNAIETQMVFQNLATKISQWLVTNYLTEYIISSQGQIMIMTRKGVLKSQNNYIGTLKMYLMELGALMAHFCCS